MSLRAIPLLVLSFILYNLIVMGFGVGAPPTEANPGSGLWGQIFSMTLLSGGKWVFTWGDLILLVTLVLLFAEIVKATFSSTSTLIDHALSMYQVRVTQPAQVEHELVAWIRQAFDSAG